MMLSYILRPLSRSASGLAAAICLLALAASARAQSGLQSFSGFGMGNDAPMVTASGFFTPAAAGKPAILFVAADINPGWHIYSITQKPGGPVTTKIRLDKSSDFKLLGDFKTTVAPKIHDYADIWPNLPVEEHEGKVTWAAPIELAAGVDPAKLQIGGAVYAQVCRQECLMPQDYKFVAHLATAKEAAAAPKIEVPVSTNSGPPPAGVSQFPSPGSGRPPAPFGQPHLTLGGTIEPPDADHIARLVITAEPAKNWHVYALAEKDPVDVSKPTLIVFTQTSGFRYRPPRASDKPIEEKTTVSQSGKVEYYDKPVSWTIDLAVPPDTAPGQYPIAGIIGYQVCQATACDSPTAARFEGTLTVGASAKSMPLVFSEATYPEAAKLADGSAKPPEAPTHAPEQPTGNHSQLPPIKVRLMEDDATGLSTILISAFFGGLILNLMPCVLPVIALKILSFVEQSHHHRSRVLALNIWYTLGLMSVFMVLAALACILKLSWGEQFTSTTFNIVMCGVVFAMALSFLGIWEIPIPGFVGSSKAAEVATHEGAAGAFAKGAVSTVLATPCSGPFLGSVFGFMLRQPPGIIFAIFATIGLGMASPYLLIGAFPQLIRFLPKPGAWMDTFKHIMGFVLLGTVVFLFTFLHRDYLVATFGMLIGIWAACWWIGHIPLTAEFGRKLTAWLQGGVIATAVGWGSFALLLPSAALIPWQPFSVDALAKYRSEGKTVMVDFTADWCLTCKTNLKFAINRPDVLKMVQTNGIVPLLADWTDGSPEIKDMLAKLESNSIPVIAIFPASHPDEAIVLRDLISQSKLLDALKDAGPSQSIAAVKETAMQ